MQHYCLSCGYSDIMQQGKSDFGVIGVSCKLIPLFIGLDKIKLDAT